MENLTALEPIRGPRPYKSRRERPCDLCRTRKVACRIDVVPPCDLCRMQGGECTFKATSTARKRPTRHDETFFNHSPSKRRRASTARVDSPPIYPTASFSVASREDSVTQLEANRSQGHPPSCEHQHTVNSPCTNTSDHSEQARPPEGQHNGRLAALESYDGMTARVADESYLYSHFPWNDDDEYALPHVTYRRVSDGTRPTVFVVVDERFAQAGEPRMDATVLQIDTRDVAAMFTDEQRVRLVNLFFEYVYPHFPVLSKTWFLSPEINMRARLEALPLSLESALYATSLPFVLYDDHLSTSLAHSSPSRATLYRICWRAIQFELHAPTLSTLQACLLMQQRGPTNHSVAATPFKASLQGWTVNLAYTLGLNRDCSGWHSLPVWERRVRTRLWWAVYTTDCWSGIETCTPPLISGHESDVPPLTGSAASTRVLDVPRECIHFYHLASLSIIAHALHCTFFSVRASAMTSNDLNKSLELARPLRSRLCDWKQSYVRDCAEIIASQSTDEPGGNPALELAYITANILLFRALLRPIETVRDLSGPCQAVLLGATTCCHDAIQLLETIVTGSGFGTFWHSWSQSNFAIVSSFLAQMLMIQTQRERKLPEADNIASVEMQLLVDRWRRAMRTGAGSGGWGHTLMSLALLQLNDTVNMLQRRMKASSS